MATDTATDPVETDRLFFEGDRSIDRLSLLADDCVWWNGMGRLPGAVWSFMLALRSRGLGSAWTTLHLHLHREREAAELLGIPHQTHMQAGLFPVAYTIGDDFARAKRAPVTEVASWNTFSFS